MPNYTVWSNWTTTTTTGNTAWGAWQTASTGSTVTVNVWVDWNGTNGTAQVIQQMPAYAPPTAAELARRVKETQRLERERKVAARKAERLLLDHLTREQAAEYRRLAYFHVIAGGRVYRIERGISGNVKLIEELPEGRFMTESFCIHPRESVPAEDNMLAQKLLLETDEPAFRRIANVTPIRRRVEQAA